MSTHGRFLLRFESKPESLASPALHRAKTQHFTTVYGHVHIKISVHDVRNIRRCTNVHGRHKILWRLNACANSVNKAFPFPPRRLGTRLVFIHTCTHTHTHLLHIHTHTPHTHTYAHIHTHAHTHTHTHAYICICTHTHIHTQTQRAWHSMMTDDSMRMVRGSK